MIVSGPGSIAPGVAHMKTICIVPALVLMLTGTGAPARAENPVRYAQATSSAQTAENLDMTAVPDLNRGEIRRVQVALREKGFDPGAVNGVLNPRTKTAVEKFQDRFGIKSTGELNNQTLFALGVVGNLGGGKEEEGAKHADEPQKEPEQSSKPRRAKNPPKEKSVQRRIEGGSRGPKGWCAAYHNGSQNCGFSTLDQCRATVSGVGGSCIPNY